MILKISVAAERKFPKVLIYVDYMNYDIVIVFGLQDINTIKTKDSFKSHYQQYFCEYTI